MRRKMGQCVTGTVRLSAPSLFSGVTSGLKEFLMSSARLAYGGEVSDVSKKAR